MPSGRAKNNKEFVQVILNEFVDNVKKEKRTKQTTISTKEEVYYNDFLTTIKNRGSKMKMINDYKSFVIANNSIDSLEKAFENLNIIKKHIEKKADNLLNVLNQIKEYNNRFSILHGSKAKLESVIVTRLNNGEELKIRFNIIGRTVEIWEEMDGKLIMKSQTPEKIYSQSNELTFTEIKAIIREYLK